jgi:CRISPR/Cas system endoribonuclease Cas6 (RAMP superfamily)
MDSNNPNVKKGMIIGVGQRTTILMGEMRKT